LYHGNPVLTRLEEAPLQEIAQQTGGVYVPARTSPLSLGAAFLNYLEAMAARDVADDPLAVPRQHSLVFLLGAFVLLVAALVLDRGKLPVSVVRDHDSTLSPSPAGTKA
jgi:hypothetical protein